MQSSSSRWVVFLPSWIGILCCSCWPGCQRNSVARSGTFQCTTQYGARSRCRLRTAIATLTFWQIDGRWLVSKRSSRSSSRLPTLGCCCKPSSATAVFRSHGGNPPRVSAELGVRVAQTFGVHPKVMDVPINWEEMDTLFWSAECVGIGECGLDRTRPHPEQQRQVFRRQVLAAKLTGKPLVLHLRGDTPQQDDEVYMEVLDILTKECLPRRHPVYLHCFVASWKVYMAWAHRYNNLLLGVTSKLVQAPDFGKVARSLPFERLALESDAPHLCPFQGHVNHPLLIHYQAGVVARIRNMPSLIVLSGAGINVRRFFRLWVPVFSNQWPGAWICSRVLMENRCRWIEGFGFFYSMARSRFLQQGAEWEYIEM